MYPLNACFQDLMHATHTHTHTAQANGTKEKVSKKRRVLRGGKRTDRGTDTQKQSWFQIAGALHVNVMHHAAAAQMKSHAKNTLLVVFKTEMLNATATSERCWKYF